MDDEQDFWKSREFWLLLGPPLALILLAFSYWIYASIRHLPPDNPLEEKLETLIELGTGRKVDLSP